MKRWLLLIGTTLCLFMSTLTTMANASGAYITSCYNSDTNVLTLYAVNMDVGWHDVVIYNSNHTKAWTGYGGSAYGTLAIIIDIPLDDLGLSNPNGLSVDVRDSLGRNVIYNANITPGYILANGYSSGSKWQVDKNGVLTIAAFSDSGTIGYYEYADDTPWWPFREIIEVIDIQEGITKIGRGALSGLRKTAKVIIPSSVQSIDSRAFLRSVYSDIYYVGDSEQWNLIKGHTVIPNTTEIHYNYQNPNQSRGFCGVDGDNLTWIFENGKLTIYGSGGMANFEDGYNSVPWYHLRDEIEQIELTSGLTNIASYAFYNCSHVSSVKIPEGVTEIGAYAFEMMDAIKRIDIPYSLKRVGVNAFFGCNSLSEIHYTGTINLWQTTDIADGNSNLLDARRIYDVTTGHCVITFDPNDGTGTMEAIVFDPDITLELPKNTFSAPSDNYFKTWIIGDKRYNPGDKFQFTGDTTVKALWYPFIDGVIDYGYCNNESDNTSWRLQNDGKLIISGNVNGNGAMPDYASISETPWFPYIDKIQALHISATITSIGSNAFSSCPALKTVSLSSSVSAIKSNAFASCSALTEVTYDGSAAQWDSIIIVETGNTSLTKAKISYNSKAGEPYFRIGTDTNQFRHRSIPYKFHDNNYLTLLFIEQEFINISRITRDLNGSYGGVCHGVALSMAYANQGLLDYSSITANADSYWHMGGYYKINSLGDPIDDKGTVISPEKLNIEPINKQLADMLLYYTLTQSTVSGCSTKSVAKGGWHIKSEDKRLSNFLSALVEEAKHSGQNEKPFVVGCFYGKDKGHSILVYGYQWNDRNNQHEVLVYDENDRYTENSENQRKLIINSDYSGFTFQDHNGIQWHKEWRKLEYFGIDTIFNGIRQVHSTQSTNLSTADFASLFSEDSRADSSDDKMTISIPAFKKFRVQNAEGEYLSFDGVNYDGNMTVYSCNLKGLENDCYWYLTVDTSESFTLNDTESSCALLLETNNQGYAVYADGADSVTISGDEVSVTGDSVHFDMDIASQSNNCLMYSASGTANGSMSLKNNGDTFTINTEDGCSDFNLLSYDADFSPSSIVSNGEVEDTLDIPKGVDSNVIPSDISVSVNGQEIRANINSSDSHVMIFCAIYNNSGQMISARSVQVTSESNYQFQFDGQEFDYAKVFIVDSNFRPLCESKRTS